MRKLLDVSVILLTLAFILVVVPLWNDTASSQGVGWRPVADVNVSSTPVQVVPRNASRVALVCTNTSLTTAVRLADATVTTTSGVQLQPRGTMTYTSTAALYAVAESGTVTLACSEELK